MVGRGEEGGGRNGGRQTYKLRCSNVPTERGKKKKSLWEAKEKGGGNKSRVLREKRKGKRGYRSKVMKDQGEPRQIHCKEEKEKERTANDGQYISVEKEENKARERSLPEISYISEEKKKKETREVVRRGGKKKTRVPSAGKGKGEGISNRETTTTYS